MTLSTLRNGEIYYKIPAYSMKCRLYPNKTQAKLIDDILDGLRIAHNMALYDMFYNMRNTREYKSEDGKIVHFPDLKVMAKAAYFNELKTRHPKIQKIPSKAWQGKNGIVLADINKMLNLQVDTKLRPVEKSKPFYYSKKKLRRSFTVQIACTAIREKDNPNALYVNVPKVGHIKCRGWNRRLRFITSKIDFMQYAKMNPKKCLTITVKKDNCNDYWIVFTLLDVLKPSTDSPTMQKKVGIDVGVKDIIITSDGKKYPNKYFKKKEKKHLKALNRRMSRRQGWSNEQFRKTYKENTDIKPSKRYLHTVLSHAKLERKIARRRTNYNHQCTIDVIRQNRFIAMESLNITGMFKNKNLSKSLADAAMGEVLSMLDYKSAWYKRLLQPINQWQPSSKRCCKCGYIKKDLTLSVRAWECPVCRIVHDRDINAAKNILYFALHNKDTAQAA